MAGREGATTITLDMDSETFGCKLTLHFDKPVSLSDVEWTLGAALEVWRAKLQQTPPPFPG